jgi:hypothetical protein
MNRSFPVTSLLTIALSHSYALATDYIWASPIGFSDASVLQYNAPPIGPSIIAYGTTPNWVAFDDWSAADFTGFSTGTPLSSYQREVTSGYYGATAVQVKGEQFGLQLHSWSMAQYGYGIKSVLWGNGGLNTTPWSTQFGSAPSMCMSYFQAVPNQFYGSAPAYIFSVFYLSDPASGKSFWITVNSWDNRSNFQEAAYFDNGTQAAAIGSYYGNNLRYTTLINGSSTASGGTYSQDKWLGLCITKENLSNMVADLNSKYQMGLSGNLTNYVVSLYGVQPEISMQSANENSWFGMKAREIWYYTRY